MNPSGVKINSVAITPRTQELMDESTRIEERCRSLIIHCDPEYEETGSLLKNIKATSKALTDERMAMTRPLDESKSRIMDWFRRPLGVLERAEGAIKKAMLAYTEEERRIADAEAERQREIAREEQARKVAALEFEAASADDEEDAHDLQLRAEITGAKTLEWIRPEQVGPKMTGISVRKLWKARIVDAAQIPREHLLVTPKQIEALQQYLDSLARVTKGSSQIAGVENYFGETISSTREGE